eukprot:11172126-Lingulodinium_polyedra.AAC.1
MRLVTLDKLFGGCSMYIWWLFGGCSVAVGWLRGGCFVVAWLLFGCCLAAGVRGCLRGCLIAVCVLVWRCRALAHKC